MALALLRFKPPSQPAEVSPMDRRIHRRLLTPGRWLAIVIAAAVLAGALTFGLYGMTSTLSVPAERLVVSQVQSGSFHDYVPISGTVQPHSSVYLDAVDGGQVLQVLVEEGAVVAAGQPLVRLGNTNLQLQLINSEAQLSEQLNRLTATKLGFEQTRLAHARELIDVRFQIERSRAQLARLRALGSGAIKRADLEDAQLDLTRLEQMERELTQAAATDVRLQREQIAQLDRAVQGLGANLELARQNLARLTIRAPLAGQLTSLEAQQGESKLAGQRVGRIDQLAFKVVAWIDEHYLERVAPGQSATTRIADSEQRLQLVKVYPEVRDRQFKVDLEFAAAPPAGVRRGQRLELRLEIGAAKASLLLANGAFYDDNGGQWVFVVHAGAAQRRAVELGRRNPEHIEVLAGLQAGERVITSSYVTLQQFERIELRGSADSVTRPDAATSPAGTLP